MNGRLAAAALLSWLALPLTMFGLIDPLEGGVALLAAVVVYGVISWLTQSRPPRLLWIPFASAIVIGIAAIVNAILQAPSQHLPSDSAGNPLRANNLAMLLMTAYRIADVLAIVGAAVFAWQSTRRALAERGR